MNNSNNLIWIDLEMTGLDPEQHRILELATLVTDSRLNILSEGPVFAIYQSESQLSLMDSWNVRVHTNTGLLKRVRSSHYNEDSVSSLTVKFLKNWVSYRASPICGSSIAQDRRFLLKYMPNLEGYFNHRCLDVSTVKELMMRWRPDLVSGLKLCKSHKALEDVRESVSELIYYRDTFMRLK